MIVPASIAQDKLARDQYPNTFTLNDMVLPTTYAPVPITQVIVARCECSGFGSLFAPSNDVFFRDFTSDPSIAVTIGSILGGFAFLLLLAALAYFLWRVRQGRVHVERISLAHIVPRMSLSTTSTRRC
jgi:protein-S-isoprenylcysteine O-methyltransferase Ste14